MQRDGDALQQRRLATPRGRRILGHFRPTMEDDDLADGEQHEQEADLRPSLPLELEHWVLAGS